MPLVVSSVFSTADAQQWHAELFSKNHDFVEVSVDTRGVPSNSRLEDVTFQVTFYDVQHHSLDRRTYRFTDSKLASLKPNVVHRRYFQHGYRSAASVTGEYMEYTTVVGGGKFDKNSPERRTPGRLESAGTHQAQSGKVYVTGVTPGSKRAMESGAAFTKKGELVSPKKQHPKESKMHTGETVH